MKVTVIRLKNAPKGAPYVIERVDDLTPEQAGQLSVSWWESRGTLSMILLADDKEDSRYTREYMDESRVPEDWVKPKKPKKPVPPVPDALMAQAPARPRPPPTLRNNRNPQPPKKQEVCAHCLRVVPKQAKRDEADEHSRCAACGQAYVCTTCMRVYPASRLYDGDDDPTPSGRQANHRCMGCGAPQRSMTGRDLWTQYSRGRK